MLPRPTNASAIKSPNHTGPSPASNAQERTRSHWRIVRRHQVRLNLFTAPVHTLGVQGLQVAELHDTRPPSSYLRLGLLLEYNDVLP